MNKILIPTDFSQYAGYAAQVALTLAKQPGNELHSELHFLHIASIPPQWIYQESNSQLYADTTKQVKDCHHRLDQLVALGEEAGVTSHKHLLYNKNYMAILEYVQEHEINLIVMGSKGASGLKEFVVGSNTQKIVRHSSVPVLVVKSDPGGDFKLRRIAFVSNFEEQIMDQFKLFVSLAQVWKAQLYLLFVNTPSNFTDTLTTKIKMGNYAMHAPGLVENTYIFNDYNFQHGVSKFCEAHDIDMVGMITHQSQGWHIFHNSLTEHMVNHTDLPLLTMHFSEIN